MHHCHMLFGAKSDRFACLSTAHLLLLLSVSHLPCCLRPGGTAVPPPAHPGGPAAAAAAAAAATRR